MKMREESLEDISILSEPYPPTMTGKTEPRSFFGGLLELWEQSDCPCKRPWLLTEGSRQGEDSHVALAGSTMPDPTGSAARVPRYFL